MVDFIGRAKEMCEYTEQLKKDHPGRFDAIPIKILNHYV